MKLSSLTDDELWKLANNSTDKDNEATNILLIRFKHFINIIATRISSSAQLSSMDSFDLTQEGSMAVIRAISSFNGQGNFTSYCNKCIKNAIITTIRTSNRDKNKPFIDYISLSSSDDEEDDVDKSTISIDSKVFDPEKEYIDKESEKELKTTIKDTLSDLENKIFQLYIDGYSYIEIGRKTNKSVKSVDNAIQRIRKKLCNKLK